MSEYENENSTPLTRQSSAIDIQDPKPKRTTNESSALSKQASISIDMLNDPSTRKSQEMIYPRAISNTVSLGNAESIPGLGNEDAVFGDFMKEMEEIMKKF
jgi:hypothetical protein